MQSHLSTTVTTTTATETSHPRRVSFDLSHNIIHVLPTFEQCCDAAKKKTREEKEKRGLNKRMLSDDIINEIQQDCYARSRQHNEEEEDQPVIKSCLKKVSAFDAQPQPSQQQQQQKKKKNHNKKGHKKRKRQHHKTPSINDNVPTISVY